MFWVQDPWAGVPSVGLRPLAPWGGPLIIVVLLLFVGHWPKGVGPNFTTFLPLLPVSLWFLLYILHCGKLFLLVLRRFSWLIALQIVITWVCLWEEMSSESSYLAILATS